MRPDQPILLGTDVIVTPFYHPVRLAEDVAVIEALTDGRLILGAAIGYRLRRVRVV
ncbi:MAG: LLM class flavin-dependent oxidoreductase [Chloroflexota bacterium]